MQKYPRGWHPSIHPSIYRQYPSIHLSIVYRINTSSNHGMSHAEPLYSADKTCCACAWNGAERSAVQWRPLSPTTDVLAVLWWRLVNGWSVGRSDNDGIRIRIRIRWIRISRAEAQQYITHIHNVQVNVASTVRVRVSVLATHGIWYAPNTKHRPSNPNPNSTIVRSGRTDGPHEGRKARQEKTGTFTLSERRPPLRYSLPLRSDCLRCAAFQAATLRLTPTHPSFPSASPAHPHPLHLARLAKHMPASASRPGG